MDWIDEQLEKLKRRLTYVSLRKSLAVYILAAVAAVIVLSMVTWQMCKSWTNVLASPYEELKLLKTTTLEGQLVFFQESYQNVGIVPLYLRVLLLVLSGIQNFCVIIYAILAIVVVAKLYYRDKLDKPIQLLLTQAEHIGNDKLDYCCRYYSEDEMGKLCNAVDDMRLKLIENQGSIWGQMEEQRRLNAAFAHDLRTPLTVLHGYVDLLLGFYSQGSISQEKLKEILEMMNHQLYRLEEFGDTMKQIHSLEDRKAKRKRIKLSGLKEKLKETVSILDHTQDLQLDFQDTGEEDPIVEADQPLILEVADNLLSNALRYARTRITLQLELDRTSQKLYLYIRDDGRGFSSEELKMAKNAYYSEEKSEGSHFGIGLSICQILCEKHGGNLSLSNSMYGGAIVCGEFYVGKRERKK